MKCNQVVKIFCAYVLPCCLALLSVTCKENLPVYEDPKNVLGVNVTLVEQLNDRVAPPNQQMVHIVMEAENIFDEVFLDSVNIQGTVRIWWKRKPVRYKTIFLTENNLLDRNLISNGKMMLLPGQKITLDMYWNMRSDDGIYLPREMNFAYLRRRVCDFNVACADPEEFVIEASLSVYDKVGMVRAPAHSFTFIARTCISCGYPPCPIPPGGCG